MRPARLLVVLGFALAACNASEEEGTGAGSLPETAAEIGAWGVDLAGRDLSVAPGDDFERYANGGWLDDFEIPADLASYGTFVQLMLDAEEDVRAIVEELASGSPPTTRAENALVGHPTGSASNSA